MPSLPTDAAETPVEGNTITGNTGAMGGATLSPQRLAQQMIITKEALNQATGNMGAVIAADFGRSIAVAQDAVAFKSITGAAGAGGTGQYTKGTENGTDGLIATDAEDVRDLWAAITANGAETGTSFCTHPTIAAHLMGIVNVTAVSPLVANGQIFGYDMVTGGSIPTIDMSAVNANLVITGGAAAVLGSNFDAMYFVYYGQWSDLFACSWGGLDVTLDPYSGSSAGNVKIVVDNYFDAKVRRSGSIGALMASDVNIA
jgi:HK97 family phage major capsid protein